MLLRVFTAAPHSLPMSRLLTSRSYKSSGRVRRAAVKMRESMGKKRYNARDRAGYFRAKCNFDPLRVGILERFLDT